MANEQTTDTTERTHTPIGNRTEAIDHVRAFQGQDNLMAHLTEVHGAQNIPVAKAGQHKAHMLLHPEIKPEQDAPAPAAEPTPAEGPWQGPLTELDTLKAQVAALQAAKVQRSTKPDFSAGRNALFSAAVRTLDTMVADLKDDDPILQSMSREDAARLVSQAIHHFATGRDAAGRRIWPATTLPKPNRSDWR